VVYEETVLLNNGKELRGLSAKTGESLWVSAVPRTGCSSPPAHNCACFIDSKLSGFNALAAEGSKVEPTQSLERLQKGPAYGSSIRHSASAKATVDKSAFGIRHSRDWPAFRHDAARRAYGDLLARLGPELTILDEFSADELRGRRNV